MMVVAGSVDPAPLREAGWSLRGTLSTGPFDAFAGATRLDAEQVLDDPVLDAVALDGEDRDVAGLLPELRAAGLLVLLTGAAPLDTGLLRAARAVVEPADAAVGLLRRWEPWALTVAAALPLVGAPPVQVTVRGWPRGRQDAAELVDLVTAWCGDVVAAVAAPAPLPAVELTGGAAVAWALLTAGGATVLVSHEGPLVVRLSFPTARLEAGPDGVRWEGGADLPLLPTPYGSGLVAAAAALRAAVGGGDVAADTWPWPADLSDLLVAARVLEALRSSARTEQLVPVA